MSHDTKAWKLFKLTSGSGSAPHIWGAAVEKQIERLRAARDDKIAYRYQPPHDGPIEPMSRLEYEAHFLLVAIRNVVRIAEAIDKLHHSRKLAGALADFRETFPHAANLRDYAEHFVEYQLGRGKHQEGENPQVSPDSRLWLVWWGADDPRTAPLTVSLGDRQIDLERAAEAAVELAHAAHKAALEGWQEAAWAEADAAKAAAETEAGTEAGAE
jgi:hypothetical protein